MARGSIYLVLPSRAVVADAVRLVLLHVDRGAVVRTGRLGEEVVLV